MVMTASKVNNFENDVTAYIAHFPLEVQVVLKALRRTIKEAAPEAEELIS